MEELTRIKQKHLERLLEFAKEMPTYIQEYVDQMLIDRSPSTLLGYLRDYKSFFEWCMAEGLLTCKISEIPLSFLEHLRKKEVDSYIRFLNSRTPNKAKAINRKISALKSLFRYLTTQTEDDNGECYFYRNVMNKITFIGINETKSSKEKAVADIILHDNEDLELIDFIENKYESLVADTRKHRYFLRDKERDLALISLLLASGIRVSEAANIQIADIDLKQRSLKVIRKGDKKDTIPFKKFALPHLQHYIEVRKSRYKADAKNPYLFLTIHKGSSHPMTIRAIENITEKYSKAFINRKISPHKLRHTMATKLAENGTPLHIIQEQLGHSDPKTTSIYMNSTLKEMKKYV